MLKPDILLPSSQMILYGFNFRSGSRIQVYYNGVGIVREPSPEEMEELFQEHLQNRKSMLVESAGTYYNKGEEKGGCYYGESF